MGRADGTRSPGTFAYEERARGPFFLVTTGFTIAFFTYAITGGAPWYVLAIAAVTVLAMAATIIWDVRGSMVLDDRHVVFRHGRRELRFALDDIARIEVNEWSDSRDVHVRSQKGDRILVPHWCVPRTGVLRREFGRRGVTVERT